MEKYIKITNKEALLMFFDNKDIYYESEGYKKVPWGYTVDFFKDLERKFYEKIESYKTEFSLNDNNIVVRQAVVDNQFETRGSIIIQINKPSKELINVIFYDDVDIKFTIEEIL